MRCGLPVFNDYSRPRRRRPLWSRPVHPRCAGGGRALSDNKSPIKRNAQSIPSPENGHYAGTYENFRARRECFATRTFSFPHSCVVGRGPRRGGLLLSPTLSSIRWRRGSVRLRLRRAARFPGLVAEWWPSSASLALDRTSNVSPHISHPERRVRGPGLQQPVLRTCRQRALTRRTVGISIGVEMSGVSILHRIVPACIDVFENLRAPH